MIFQYRLLFAHFFQGFNPCLVIGMGIAQSHSFLKRFHISRQVWGEFCTLIGDGYLANNPYHNAGTLFQK